MQQNWIHCIFLAFGCFITWAAWVLFGIFATVRLIVIDFCQNGADIIARKPGAQVIIPCPDLNAAMESIYKIYSNIGDAVITANIRLNGTCPSTVHIGNSSRQCINERPAA
jgi:hypothetical protein